MFMCVLYSNCAPLKTWTAVIWRAVTPPRCILLQATTVWPWWNTCCIMGPMCTLKIKGTIIFLWVIISVTIIALCWHYLTVTDSLSFSWSVVWFLYTTRVRMVTMRWQSCWWDMERLWTWRTFGSSHHYMKLQPRANMRSANYCSRFDTSDGEIMHMLASQWILWLRGNFIFSYRWEAHFLSCHTLHFTFGSQILSNKQTHVS